MEEKRMREEEDKKRKKIGHVEDDSLRQVFNEKKKRIFNLWQRPKPNLQRSKSLSKRDTRRLERVNGKCGSEEEGC